jgi:TolB-like protein/DNA-binding winged helix-turn-helix (wHTH) protein/Flp pilus assembly protein TadD
MSAPTDPPRPVRFGVFEVDLEAGELRRQGVKVRLQDQPFQVLAILLEKPGGVVTREELQKRLWSDDTFVDFETGLNTAIKKIREALGDSADNPRFVETLHRRGYRFIAPVEGAVGAGLARPREGRALPYKSIALAAGAVAVIMAALVAFNVAGLRTRLFRATPPAPKIESIAVLPLENLSNDPEQEYFADGMTEELITHLGTVGALHVISRTSVMRYKGTKKPLPEIARELNVDAIVEGTVRRSGDRVRITANLLHAPSDRHLWAAAYERNLRDVLTLQDEVAGAIARQIKIKLTPQEHARLASARPVNPEGYRLYLEGRYYFLKRTRPAFEKSIQLLQRALEKDPNFALAYAGLSESYGILPFYGGALPKEAFPKAEAAARKALELDSTLAEAHAALGFVLFYYDWDWLAAERELRRAIELKPSYVVGHHWYAEYLSAMGRHEQAFAEIRRAQELDPVSPLLRAIGGEVYYCARRYDEAIEQCRKGLELDSNFGLAHANLGWGYIVKGMYKEAGLEFEKAGAAYGGNYVGLAVVCAAMGNKGKALKILDQARERSSHGEASPWHLARAYILLGDNQRALVWLQKADEDRDPAMAFTKAEPAFAPLRSDPRFQALLRRMNLPE